MRDFFGSLSDSELLDKADHLWSVLDAAPGDYSATAAQATDLKDKISVFETGLNEHIAAQAAARAKTQAKDGLRDDLEKALRFIVQQAKLNGAGDEQIAQLGVPTSSPDLPSDATRPIGMCGTSERLRHLLDFRDEAAPDVKRRPRGVLGCEIYRKLGGAPPVDLKECEFLAFDTATPYMVEYDGADAGQTAHYIFRWRFRDESTSALSETVSATVTG